MFVDEDEARVLTGWEIYSGTTKNSLMGGGGGFGLTRVVFGNIINGRKPETREVVSRWTVMLSVSNVSPFLLATRIQFKNLLDCCDNGRTIKVVIFEKDRNFYAFNVKQIIVGSCDIFPEFNLEISKNGRVGGLKRE